MVAGIPNSGKSSFINRMAKRQALKTEDRPGVTVNKQWVKISEEIIKEAVLLSERYITDRFLPDKAIDVIDEAGSRVNLKNKPSKKICAGCIGKSDENEKKRHLQMKRYS